MIMVHLLIDTTGVAPYAAAYRLLQGRQSVPVVSSGQMGTNVQNGLETVKKGE